MIRLFKKLESMRSVPRSPATNHLALLWFFGGFFASKLDKSMSSGIVASGCACGLLISGTDMMLISGTDMLYGGIRVIVTSLTASVLPVHTRRLPAFATS